MHDGTGRIEARNLTKRFGEVTAVSDLSFTVEPGYVTGFLGPNGAGKTTALRMLLGLVTPTSGGSTINGVGYYELGNPATVVGAVLESTGFHPGRTALKHLLVYTAAMGLPDGRAEQMLQLVGLGSARERAAGGFSLGMRQRLALATALLGDPQILVLDEPANGLDPEGIAWLRKFLRSYAKSGKTVLLSSHLLAEIEQTVDNVLIISQGKPMYQGSVEALRRTQQTKVIVRASDPEQLVGALRSAEIYNIETAEDGRLVVGGVEAKQIADLAHAADIPLYGIEEQQPNLEQLYLNLTTGQYGPPQPQAPALPPGPPPPGYGYPPPYQQGYPPPPPPGHQSGYQPTPEEQQAYQRPPEPQHDQEPPTDEPGGQG